MCGGSGMVAYAMHLSEHYGDLSILQNKRNINYESQFTWLEDDRQF
jgi:hypothetical protein